jgi:hypothetical protein
MQADDLSGVATTPAISDRFLQMTKVTCNPVSDADAPGTETR